MGGGGMYVRAVCGNPRAGNNEERGEEEAGRGKLRELSDVHNNPKLCAFQVGTIVSCNKLALALRKHCDFLLNIFNLILGLKGRQL